MSNCLNFYWDEGAADWKKVLGVAGGMSVISQNITTKFRDAFETFDTVNRWSSQQGAGDLVFVDGNTAGASYLVVSKSPWELGSQTTIETRASFNLPIELAFGAHMSQRVVGQEFSVEIVDTGAPLPEAADLAIASISQATTVLTVNTVNPHGLTIGRCVGVRGVSNSAANYPQLVVATAPTPTQFTCTVATGTITAVNNSGFVYIRERLGRANNGVSQIFENATVTNANLYIRSESGDALPSGTIAGAQAVTVGTTASVQLVNSPYAYAFAPTTEFRINIQADRTQWYDSAVDAVAATTNRLLRTQVCPDPSDTYKLRIRANNAKSLTVPVAQIVSAVKSGTTTAQITCDREHGLTTADVVVVYGIRAQGATEFPNLTTATAVASIVSPTVFTIVIGTAGTITSYGGYVARVNGSNLTSALGGIAQVAQSAVLSTLVDNTRQLVLTGSANWAGAVIGDLVELVGVRNDTTGATLNVDGPWKVANLATTALTLVLPFSDQRTLPADFGSINCGGGVIRRTDLRLSFVRIFDYERERIEALARPSGDASAAAPVVVQNTVATTFTQPALVAGTAAIGDVGTIYRTTASGSARTHLISAATTNAANIKAAAGKVLGWSFSNTNAAWRYVKLHNSATAPTAGTGVSLTIAIPPNGVSNFFSEGGITFTAGIGITTVTGAADADATAVGLNDIVGELIWA
jgi:hypothetical protein